MVEDCLAGAVDLVLTKSISRSSRQVHRHHRLEALALFGCRCGDYFIRVYGNELPIVATIDVVGIVIDLCRITRDLVFVVSRNAGISGNAAFLCAVYRSDRVSADGSRSRRYFSLHHAFSRSSRNCSICSLICCLSGVYAHLMDSLNLALCSSVYGPLRMLSLEMPTFTMTP